MKLKLFLLACIVALLAFTNPGMEDFKDAAARKMQEELKDKSSFEKALGTVFENTIKEAIASKTVRKNFFLFSTYSLETDNKQYHYLGIATVIIPLQQDLPYAEQN